MRILTGLILMMSVPVCAVADVERPNSPRIFVDDYHECFAKSIPADDYGDRGTTAIYRVEAGTDRLISTFPWYTQQLFIRCIAPSPCPFIIQVVRIGPWARGSQATGNDLAIALYVDGRLLHSYSTLDIAKTSTNVERSSNHYSVFSAIPGYERGAGVDLFIVETIDGRALAFNMDTGLLVDNALRVGTK